MLRININHFNRASNVIYYPLSEENDANKIYNHLLDYRRNYHFLT